jgi:2-oxoglutarate dehydrogenase E2 component (dihydrolipoamide succinyltransferase)
MAATLDIVMPSLSEGSESVVAGWLKNPGEQVTRHEPIVEINTDKAITEVPAPASGTLVEILKHPDQPVKPGDVLGRLLASVDTPSGAASAPTPTAVAPAAVAASASRELSPAVRALIKQHHLDVSRIKGTGRGGRVTHEDVLNHLKRAAGAKTAVQSLAAGVSAPSRMVPHSQMRRKIAQHMVDSMLKAAPHVTAVFDADLSAILNHRARHRTAFETQGIRLTLTAYFIAAAVKALQAVPEVNSRWHADALEIFTDCNIGIATALDAGLVVPVIARAQKLDLKGIASRLEELTDKARRGKLALEEMQGGTFTITNHGVSGSLIATPVINQPQSAILGIGKMEKRLIVEEIDGADTIRVKPMAYVTLTIDHRVLDGFQANKFLAAFVQALADWRGAEQG